MSQRHSRGKRQRTKILPIRMSAAELQTIGERAHICGKGVSTYMREVALGSVPRARPQRLEKKAVYQLSRIGTNLNQLARIANTTGRIDFARRLEEVLGQITDAIERLS